MNKDGFTTFEVIHTIVLVCSFAIFLTLVVFGVKACNIVQHDGFKGLSEVLWEGTNSVQNGVVD